MGRKEYQYIIVLSFLLCFIIHAQCRQPRPRYDRTDGCIHQHGYVDRLHSHQQHLRYTARCKVLRGSGGWGEQLPGQYTCYDRLGTVIERIHIWPTGCWMVIERCNFTGDLCIPGSGVKWKFGGCSWNESLCVPTQEHWRAGSWVPFGNKATVVHSHTETSGKGQRTGCQERKRKLPDDHNYAWKNPRLDKGASYEENGNEGLPLSFGGSSSGARENEASNDSSYQNSTEILQNRCPNHPHADAMSPVRAGGSIPKPARRIIKNVHLYLSQVCSNPTIATAAAMHLSRKTITKIINEDASKTG
jgi:hypothetical protein